MNGKGTRSNTTSIMITNGKDGNKMTKSLAFQTLEKNVIDIIHEWQVKLGYTEETIHVYYNLDSLEHLVGIPFKTKEDAKAFLIEWRSSVKEHLGEIKLSNKGERFCIAVPGAGTCYVYENKQGNTFLLKLMEVIRKEDCNIDDVLEIFKGVSSDVICEKADGQEFDYVVYFKDKAIDGFRYCFSFGELGAFYHRFSEYDYLTIKE